MGDDKSDNVVPLNAKVAPDAPLTAEEQSATQTRAAKVQAHVFEHRVKYVLGLMMPLMIALLQNWGAICPALPFKLNCQMTAPAAQIGAEKLENLLDAGVLE